MRELTEIPNHRMQSLSDLIESLYNHIEIPNNPIHLDENDFLYVCDSGNVHIF